MELKHLQDEDRGNTSVLVFQNKRIRFQTFGSDLCSEQTDFHENKNLNGGKKLKGWIWMF